MACGCGDQDEAEVEGRACVEARQSSVSDEL